MTTIETAPERARILAVVLAVLIVAVIAVAVSAAVLAGQYTTVRLVDDDAAVTPAWQCLTDDGYRGTDDGLAMLYPSRLDALLCGASTVEVAE